MQKRDFVQFVRSGWVTLFLLVMIGIQSFFLVDYVRYWLWGIKTFGRIQAMERSAILSVGFSESKYINFLNAVIPENVSVVLTPDDSQGWFSQQNPMQFFLFPRPILLCNCAENSEACIGCLGDPEAFVMAIGDFPDPDRLSEGLVFIPYDEAGRFRGVYGPATSTPGVSDPVDLPTIPQSSIFVDLSIYAAVWTLGWMVLTLLLPDSSWLERTAYAIPTALGLSTWLIFISAYLGFKGSITHQTWVFALLLVACGGIFWLRRRSLPTLRKIVRPKIHSLAQLDRLDRLLVLALTAWIGLSAVIAAGRGYSEFDEIANWGLKGYAIAYQQSIFAGGIWGGHQLAYPMNIHLSIALFKLFSGDSLPGSKLLFPVFTFALLVASYRFWTWNAVKSRHALLGTLVLVSMPLFFVHSTLAFANLPFTAYLVLGILFGLKAMTGGSWRKYLFSGMMFAFSGWTRPEGIGFSLVLITALTLLGYILLKSRPAIRQWIYWVAPVLIVPGSWMVLLGARKMGSDQIGSALAAMGAGIGQGQFNLTRMGLIFEKVWEFVTSIPQAGFIFLVPALLFLWAVVTRSATKPQIALILLALLAAATPAGMFYVESFNNQDFGAFLDQSLDRAFLPSAVLSLLYGIILLDQFSKKANSRLT